MTEDESQGLVPPTKITHETEIMLKEGEMLLHSGHVKMIEGLVGEIVSVGAGRDYEINTDDQAEVLVVLKASKIVEWMNKREAGFDASLFNAVGHELNNTAGPEGLLEEVDFYLEEPEHLDKGELEGWLQSVKRSREKARSQAEFVSSLFKSLQEVDKSKLGSEEVAKSVVSLQNQISELLRISEGFGNLVKKEQEVAKLIETL